jgi:hypothetical protein
LVPVGDAEQGNKRSIPKGLESARHSLKLYNEESFGPCVYFLCKGIQIVYVGQAINIATRINTHRRNRIIPFDRIFYFRVPKEEMINIEKEMIKKFSPSFNEEALAMVVRKGTVAISTKTIKEVLCRTNS